MQKYNKSIIIGIIIALILLVLGFNGIMAQTTDTQILESVRNIINKDWARVNISSNPQPLNTWNIKYLSFEDGIKTDIIPLNSTTLQLDITNINKGGYKFHSAICNISGVDSVKLYIKGNNDQYTSIGDANFDKLAKYGINETWCKETGGYGFLLFAGGNQDRSYRLAFPDGQKSIILLTGSNSEIVDISYGNVEKWGGVALVKFTDENSGKRTNDNLTMVTYIGNV